MKKLLATILLLTTLPVQAATVLFVPQGGTGSSTLTGLLKGNGTGFIRTAVPGVDYQVAGSYLTSESDPLALKLTDWFSTTTNKNITTLINLSVNASQVSDFNTVFDNRLSATTTLPKITTLAGLSITKSQVSDFGTYEPPITAGTINDYYRGDKTFQATSTLRLTKSQITDFGGPYLTTIGSGTNGNMAVWGGTNTLYGIATTSTSLPAPLYGSITSLGNTTLTWTGLSTSTSGVIGNIPYFTSTNALGNVATGTITCTGSISCGTGSYVIGSNIIFNYPSTVATSTGTVVGNLAYWTGNGTPSTLGNVATTSETCTWPVACAAHAVLTGGGAITWSGISTSSAQTWTGTQTFKSFTGTSTGILDTSSSTHNALTIVTATTTNLLAIGSTTIDNLVTRVSTSTNLMALGSTTLQAITYTTATGANATTTTEYVSGQLKISSSTPMMSGTGVMTLGGASASASTTINMGKLQISGFTPQNTPICMFVVGTSWVILAKSCTP